MKQDNNAKNYNSLDKEIDKIRKISIRRKKQFSENELNKPVSFWTKKERLIDGIGKEFTIILRTKGCYWALEHAGCSMCGYIQDANIKNVDSQQIINQFNYAFENKIEEILNDTDDYILKIFNSGSFFDNSEISEDVRIYIYKKVAEISKIKEFIVESRIEFIDKKQLKEMLKYLKNTYIEIGIGLETVDDHIRNNYINKNLFFLDFIETLKLCQKMGIGIKAYLLFKPPFLNEQAAIDDCTNSIKTLISYNINSISVNPCNIQKGSLVEYLWYQKRYRPPWFYSLFECFKRSLTKSDLSKIRILCDPSGIGTKRGIHNCLKGECNKNMKQKLKQFILNQNLDELNIADFECNCWRKYQIQKSYI